MFTGENLSHLLYALATGHRDRAKNLVYTHEDLTDDERELLRPIVEDDARQRGRHRPPHRRRAPRAGPSTAACRTSATGSPST